MIYEVNIKLKDGTIEYFGTFISKYYALYNIALAKSSEGSIYINSKYNEAAWIITKKESDT